MTLVIACFERSFTAFQHSCMILSLVARRHGRAFYIPRDRAVDSIYRIYDYSVIDPSGTNITGTRWAAVSCLVDL